MAGPETRNWIGLAASGTSTPARSVIPTAMKASEVPSAGIAWVPGVSVMARGGPAVTIESVATVRPFWVATAVSRPGWNGTVQVRCSLPVLPFGLV